MATYDQAAQDYVGKLIQQYTGGLVPSSVGKAWLSVENGDSNNPFGVTGRTASGGQYLIHYPTLADGVRAAAQLLLTSPTYASTRRALEAARGNPAAAGQAIVDSPWNPHYYAGALVRALQAAGLGSGGSTSATLASTGSVGATMADFLKLPGSTLLTIAMVRQVAAQSVALGEGGDTLYNFYIDFVGHRLDSIPAPSAAFNSQLFGGAPRSPDPLSAFGDLFSWVPGFAVNASVLVAIVALGYVGIRRVAG